MEHSFNLNSPLDFNGIYIHLPFCRRICPFCNFTIFNYQELRKQSYLETILSEIDIWHNNYDIDISSCRSVYFGGGTPSLFSLDEIGLILERLKPPAEADISFELNPEDCQYDYLKSLKQCGVSRISIGIQSMNPSGLAMLKRCHTVEDNINALENVARLNFKDLNLDLIYGYPQQSLDDLEDDLAEFLKWDPSHLSAYHLTLEPKTPLAKNQYWRKWQETNEDLFWQQFKLIIARLKSAGLYNYELSNYAKIGSESPQNLIYWNQESFLGLGVGAFYRWQNLRMSNITKLNGYNNAIQNGKLPLKELEKLSTKQLLDEYLLMNLRRKTGISISELNQRFNKYDWNMVLKQPLAKLVANGLVKINGDSFSLTPSGLFVADSITCDISMAIND